MTNLYMWYLYKTGLIACSGRTACLTWPACFSSQAKSQFKRRSTANNVEIHIPVPTDADSPKFKTTVGSVKWVPENSEIVWSIKSFPVSKNRDLWASYSWLQNDYLISCLGFDLISWGWCCSSLVLFTWLLCFIFSLCICVHKNLMVQYLSNLSQCHSRVLVL